MVNNKYLINYFFIFLFFLPILKLNALLVKDIAEFSNKRGNFLFGKGIVIGLKGTGDRSKFTNIILNNILNNNNIDMNAKDVRSKNVASVMLTAKIPAFLKKGDTFNVNVSGIGDSKSLKGGTLYFSFLKGADNKIYATCQGNLIMSNKSLNKGYIENGCILEREIPNKLINKIKNTLSLKYSNLEMIYKIKKEINKRFGFRTAKAIDMKNIELTKPEEYDNIDFMYEVLNINLDMKILEPLVIDEINKIIISGNNIPIGKTTIVTKDFSLRIGKNLKNSKEKIEIDNLKIDLNGIISTNNNKTTIGDLVFSLKSLKVPFNKIVNIIYNLKEKKAFNNKIIIRR